MGTNSNVGTHSTRVSPITRHLSTPLDLRCVAFDNITRYGNHSRREIDMGPRPEHLQVPVYTGADPGCSLGADEPPSETKNFLKQLLYGGG